MAKKVYWCLLLKCPTFSMRSLFICASARHCGYHLLKVSLNRYCSGYSPGPSPTYLPTIISALFRRVTCDTYHQQKYRIWQWKQILSINYFEQNVDKYFPANILALATSANNILHVAKSASSKSSSSWRMIHFPFLYDNEGWMSAFSPSVQTHYSSCYLLAFGRHPICPSSDQLQNGPFSPPFNWR